MQTATVPAISATNLISIFSGDTFDFEVDGARFRLHRSLVARVSEPLESLMEGGMQETQQGSGPMSDIDKETFARFAEFIYSGDYNPAPPVQPPEAPCHGNDEAGMEEQVAASSAINELPQPSVYQGSDADDYYGGMGRGYKKKSWKRKKSYGYDLFSELGPKPLSASTTPQKLPGPTKDVVTEHPFPTSSMFLPPSDSNLDHLPIFMSHAKLYVFADRWIVTDLQRLAARRLDEALSMFEYSSTSPTDIATLIKYAYDHTPPRKDKPDILRRMVTVLAANNIHALRQSTHFGELQCEGGDFPKDLMEQVCARFNA
jgi:hypothetical protein